ncbi:hypothetical protein B0H10DRAFT_1953744 [Mycena sp. CBHHK59/15]|nr:hypothetical protein B0H10DRAFT_1953744 [Mycena sp. CBHHK59/15]
MYQDMSEDLWLVFTRGSKVEQAFIEGSVQHTSSRVGVRSVREERLGRDDRKQCRHIEIAGQDMPSAQRYTRGGELSSVAKSIEIVPSLRCVPGTYSCAPRFNSIFELQKGGISTTRLVGMAQAGRQPKGNAVDGERIRVKWDEAKEQQTKAEVIVKGTTIGKAENLKQPVKAVQA